MEHKQRIAIVGKFIDSKILVRGLMFSFLCPGCEKEKTSSFSVAYS